MSIDSIGNFLTIIRNGIMRSKPEVIAPYSKLKEKISDILEDEGFIKGFKIEEADNKKSIRLYLKYVDGESVIHEIDRKSTPSRRVYWGVSKFKPVKGKLGISILTTNKGLMTDKDAKHENIGGEVICTVW